MTGFPGLRQIREFFTGGNLIVRVGVVLFFGVAFLLRYVAEHSHFSIETRLSGVAVKQHIAPYFICRHGRLTPVVHRPRMRGAAKRGPQPVAS